MSISSATDRLASRPRVQPRHIVGPLLLAIGLIAVAVAIAISSTNSTVGRLSARPGTINATQSQPARQSAAAPVSSVPGGTSAIRSATRCLRSLRRPLRRRSPASAIDEPVVNLQTGKVHPGRPGERAQPNPDMNPSAGRCTM